MMIEKARVQMTHLKKKPWKSLVVLSDAEFARDEDIVKAAKALRTTSVASTNEIQSFSRQVLLRGIETSGKSVVNIRHDFGKTVSTYWPNEDKWYSAKVVDKDVMELSLDVLASHATWPSITNTHVDYAPLMYEDGEILLSPVYYIRKTTCGICC
ncbi:MAG: hypothetical protein SGARI_002821 [Bacillariaceae sp.]